jgi:hypothetical protein
VPAAFLSGAVLACGALLVLSGAAKLWRVIGRADGGGAIRAALRISPQRWRFVELAAALTESGTGLAVCTGFRPAVAGGAMAAQGALFSATLAYARHTKATGGCACVLRPKDPDATIGWPVQVRAAWLLAIGFLDAALRLPRPLPPGTWMASALTSGVVLAVMLSAERPWRTPRCGRRLWSPRRDTVRALMRHGVFEAMSAAAGPFADDFAHRRDGCVDEFWFTPATRANSTGRTVSFRVSRATPGGALAVEARLETVCVDTVRV